MPFPVSYFDAEGRPIEGAAGALEAYRAAGLVIDGLHGTDTLTGCGVAERVIAALQDHGFAVSRVFEPYPGQVARVQIDAYGESASEVEATLLAYAERAGAGLQSAECSYGRCVIERNLEEEWGATYSWRGRLVLHPTIGSLPSSSRAAAIVEEAARSAGTSYN